MNTNCPGCSTDHISSFQMIYTSGTATGNFQALSREFNTGVIETSEKIKAQSILAEQIAEQKE